LFPWLPNRDDIDLAPRAATPDSDLLTGTIGIHNRGKRNYTRSAAAKAPSRISQLILAFYPDPKKEAINKHAMQLRNRLAIGD